MALGMTDRGFPASRFNRAGRVARLWPCNELRMPRVEWWMGQRPPRLFTLLGVSRLRKRDGFPAPVCSRATGRQSFRP